MTKNYIEAALKMPDEFMAAQLYKSPKALKHTSSLYKGASKEKPALIALYQCIKEINKKISDSNAELTSQIIIASTLGFIIKLILEKEIGETQRQKLIEFFSNETVIRIAKSNED
jgi:menaquinone-dependent protoporphyrinogen IX oxidase